MIRLVEESAGIMNGGLAQRQGRCDLGEPLGYHLRARSSSVAPGRKSARWRTAGPRTWTSCPPALDPVQLILDRHGDQLLDLIGELPSAMV